MRVLFVDDERRVLEAIRRMLFDAAGDWEIETATDGSEALTLLDSAPFDVIVTDMRMPGMDGGALLAEVHARYPSMTRIVLSGQTEQQNAYRALGTAHQYLTKPCSGKALTEIVENAFFLRALTPNARVAELASAVHRLPVLPRVSRRLLALIDGAEPSVREAADLVAEDPGLSANVLRAANSALFARGQVVGDVRTATARLGLDLLRTVVLSEGATSKIPPPKLERMHAAALEAASLASRIVAPADQRTAFTAALLSDIGTLVLEQGAPDEVAAARVYAEEAGIPVHAAERELLGSSHAEIGGYILGLWGVPPVIVDAVLGHHELGRDPSPISAGVHIAHRIVAGEPVPIEVAERAGVVEHLDEIRAMHARDRLPRALDCEGRCSGDVAPNDFRSHIDAQGV